MSWEPVKERSAAGLAERRRLGRQRHGEFNAKKRRASALTVLERAERGRIPALLNLKHALMAASPFGYFRGAAAVLAADLAELPRTRIETQLCGDAHVRNLGAFAAPDGRLVFDINDFDESLPGPFEWDLKRMAASLVVAGREAGQKDAAAGDAVRLCVMRYAQRMTAFAEMPFLDVARAQVHRLGSAVPVHDSLLKAERATPQHTLEQLTVPAGRKGERRFRVMKPMLTRVPDTEARRVVKALEEYKRSILPERVHLLERYRAMAVAFKVVGTGSVGLRDYCIYLEGNGAVDPLFLQVKEEAASAYAPYLKKARAAKHNGQRVAEGQRAMQVQSDPFLGWTRMEGRDYLVRQLNDHKGSIEIDDLKAGGLEAYAEICGELLARGHARSGDALTIASYVGSGAKLAEALAKFGAAYADQTEKDWKDLCGARKRKRGKAPKDRTTNGNEG
jgi:uncharacterized protein (DUF2252 family)